MWFKAEYASLRVCGCLVKGKETAVGSGIEDGSHRCVLPDLGNVIDVADEDFVQEDKTASALDVHHHFERPEHKDIFLSELYPHNLPSKPGEQIPRQLWPVRQWGGGKKIEGFFYQLKGQIFAYCHRRGAKIID